MKPAKVDPMMLLVSPTYAWGREEFKPECDRSQAACELLNQKNLTKRDIDKLKKMGFNIRTVAISSEEL